MKRSTDRILTTHVGSLIRPKAIQDILAARQNGVAVDEAYHLKVLTESVAGIVKRQAETGVDVVSDGEFGKSISWSQYVLERLDGFERRPVASGGADPFARGLDRERFPEFYAELDAHDRAQGRFRRRRGRAIRVGLRRADRLYRAGRAPARHRQFQGGARRGGRGGGVPAGRRAGERHPRPQERVLRERRGAGLRHRRRHAGRVPDHLRGRASGPGRRRARRGHLRPHGPAGEHGGIPRVARPPTWKR